MYTVKMHKDGYQVGEITYTNIVDAVTACRVANRLVRASR